MILDDAIIDAIDTNKLTTQSELVAKLAERGIEVNQSTLSRHLRRLGVIKERGQYAKAPDTGMMRVYAVTKIMQSPPNMLVIRTRPGHAQPIALLLDEDSVPGIAGTVGGDDTIFIASTGELPLSELEKRISELLS